MIMTRFDAAPPPINALVSIYADGSVLIVSGGQEMGQGLHTKLKQVICTASTFHANLSTMSLLRVRAAPMIRVRAQNPGVDHNF